MRRRPGDHATRLETPLKLLAFETATEACSVAVWNDGEVLERYELAPRRHAELALPWADALLAEAGVAKSQLDAIAVGRGPGAFTGVRLAVGIAQGIALALDRPVLPVSTLAALAMRAGAGRVVAAIDARMGEVYVGAFQRDGDSMVALDAERVPSPAGRTTLPKARSRHGLRRASRMSTPLRCRMPPMWRALVHACSSAARASRPSGWSRPTCATRSR